MSVDGGAKAFRMEVVLGRRLQPAMIRLTVCAYFLSSLVLFLLSGRGCGESIMEDRAVGAAGGEGIRGRRHQQQNWGGAVVVKDESLTSTRKVEMELSAMNAIIEEIAHGRRKTKVLKSTAALGGGAVPSGTDDVETITQGRRTGLLPRNKRNLDGQPSLSLHHPATKTLEQVGKAAAVTKKGKLAFLFIVKDCLAVESLWLRFFEDAPADEYAIFVHFDGLTLDWNQPDGLVPLPFTSPEAQKAIKGDVHFVPSADKVVRFSVPLARLVTYMSRVAYVTDEDVSCFIPVSDSNIPIQSFRGFRGSLLVDSDDVSVLPTCRSEVEIHRLAEGTEWKDYKQTQWIMMNRENVRLINEKPETIWWALDYLEDDWTDPDKNKWGGTYGGWDEHLIPTLLTHLYSIPENRHLPLPSETGLTIEGVTVVFWPNYELVWEYLPTLEGKGGYKDEEGLLHTELEGAQQSMLLAEGDVELANIGYNAGHPVSFSGDLLTTFPTIARLRVWVTAFTELEIGLMMRKVVNRYDDRQRLAESHASCKDIRVSFDDVAKPAHVEYSTSSSGQSGVVSKLSREGN